MDISRLKKLSLTVKFGLLSLIPIILLGVVLGQSLSKVIRDRSLKDARGQAELVARLGFEQTLRASDLRGPLDRRERRALNGYLRRSIAEDDLARVKIRNPELTVVYSDDRQLIGRTGTGSAGLESALRGRVASEIVNLDEKPEDPRDRGLGEVLKISVPLTFGREGAPAGVLELYRPYDRIASSIQSDTHKLYLILLGGLSLLYATLFRIIAGASKRLRRQAGEKEQQALHDSLTGLPNRTLFRDLVEREILNSRRNKGLFAVIIMDLDRFKEINDTLGHYAGDLLLKRMGSRLRSVLRDADTVARLGGDEFAILLPDMPDRNAVIQTVKKILKNLEEPFVVSGLALEVEASIGISLYPGHGDGVDALFQAADVAMYVAKEAHSGFEFYTSEQHQYTPTRLALVGELRRAIDEDELVLHFQPKADVRTGAVTGVEALARWNHPRHGLLPPDEFIPLAEHTSLIRPVTLHLLESALRQSKEWREDGLNLSVAVNLSVQNLMDLQLPDDLGRLMERWSAPPAALHLEITESTIMSEPRRAMAVLTRLSEMGVELAIDDFGTGYSSLAYLKQLPVSTIKIDKSFVLGMEEDEDDAVIVQSTIDLGHNLGLMVVAEGVENEEGWNRLHALGCDSAQGYYLTKPLENEKFRLWLSAYDDLRAQRPGGAAAAGREPGGAVEGTVVEGNGAPALPDPSELGEPIPG